MADWLTRDMTQSDRRLMRAAQWQRIADRLIFAAAAAVILFVFIAGLTGYYE